MKKAIVLVLAGQSNAVGVGHIEYLPRHYSAEKIAEYNAGYESILINYYSHNIKSNGFVPTGLHCTELKGGTLGPEVGMAERLHELYPDREFFIVKCATGGTSLYPDREFFIVKCATGGTSLWRDWLSPSGGEAYDPDAYAESPETAVYNVDHGLPMPTGWHFNELVKITRESLAWFEANGYEPEIRGFCWMQGEADACDPTTNEQYGGRYDAFVNDFRAAFPAYTQTCVFVDAGVSTTWPFYREMNAFKSEYAATHEGCVFVDTIASGLTTAHEPEPQNDPYHYDVNSTIDLGRLFIDALGVL